MNIQENNANPMMSMMQSRIRESLLQRLKPKEREITEKIRGALRGQPLEEVLRRFAGGQSAKDAFINEEDLIIGVSKLNANLYLSDLKEFITAIKSITSAASNGQEKISVAETIQLIGS